MIYINLIKTTLNWFAICLKIYLWVIFQKALYSLHNGNICIQFYFYSFIFILFIKINLLLLTCILYLLRCRFNLLLEFRHLSLKEFKFLKSWFLNISSQPVDEWIWMIIQNFSSNEYSDEWSEWDFIIFMMIY